MRKVLPMMVLVCGFSATSVFARADMNLPSCDDIQTDMICDTLYNQLNKFQKKGSPEAATILATFYMTGYYGLPKDPEKAVKLLKKAARKRSAAAKYELAKLYLTGEYVDKDEEEGLELMASAAKGGYADAELTYNLLMLQKTEDEAQKKEFLDNIKNMDSEDQDTVNFFLGRYYMAENNRTEAKKYLVLASTDGHQSARDLLTDYFPDIQAESPLAFAGDIERITVTGERPDVNETARDLLRMLKSSGAYTGKSSGTRLKGQSCTRDANCRVLNTRDDMMRFNNWIARFSYYPPWAQAN